MQSLVRKRLKVKKEPMPKITSERRVERERKPDGDDRKTKY